MDHSVLIDYYTGDPNVSDAKVKYENYHKIMFVPVRIESHFIFGIGFESTNVSSDLNQSEEIKSFRFVIDMDSNEMFFIRIYSVHNVMSCYTTLQPGIVLLNFNSYTVENWRVKLSSRGSLDSRTINGLHDSSDIPLLAIKHSQETDVDSMDMSGGLSTNTDALSARTNRPSSPTTASTLTLSSLSLSRGAAGQSPGEFPTGATLHWKPWFKTFLSNYAGEFNMATEVCDAAGNVLVPPNVIYYQNNKALSSPAEWHDDLTQFLERFQKFNPKVATRGITLAGGSFLGMGGLEAIDEGDEDAAIEAELAEVGEEEDDDEGFCLRMSPSQATQRRVVVAQRRMAAKASKSGEKMDKYEEPEFNEMRAARLPPKRLRS